MLYVPGVFSPRLCFTGWRRLEIFLGSRPALLQLCLAIILLRWACICWRMYLFPWKWSWGIPAHYGGSPCYTEPWSCAPRLQVWLVCWKDGDVIWTVRGLCGYFSGRLYGLVSQPVSCTCRYLRRDGGCPCLFVVQKSLQLLWSMWPDDKVSSA